MAGSVALPDLGVILGALVDVLDLQRDRRAGGDEPAGRFVLKHA
jgi:hypothetical protein